MSTTDHEHRIKELEAQLAQAEKDAGELMREVARLREHSKSRDGFADRFARLLEEAVAHLEGVPMSQCVMGPGRLKSTIRAVLREYAVQQSKPSGGVDDGLTCSGVNGNDWAEPHPTGGETK